MAAIRYKNSKKAYREFVEQLEAQPASERCEWVIALIESVKSNDVLYYRQRYTALLTKWIMQWSKETGVVLSINTGCIPIEELMILGADPNGVTDLMRKFTYKRVSDAGDEFWRDDRAHSGLVSETPSKTITKAGRGMTRELKEHILQWDYYQSDESEKGRLTSLSLNSYSFNYDTLMNIDGISESAHLFLTDVARERNESIDQFPNQFLWEIVEETPKRSRKLRVNKFKELYQQADTYNKRYLLDGMYMFHSTLTKSIHKWIEEDENVEDVVSESAKPHKINAQEFIAEINNGFIPLVFVAGNKAELVRVMDEAMETRRLQWFYYRLSLSEPGLVSKYVESLGNKKHINLFNKVWTISNKSEQVREIMFFDWPSAFRPSTESSNIEIWEEVEQINKRKWKQRLNKFKELYTEAFHNAKSNMIYLMDGMLMFHPTLAKHIDKWFEGDDPLLDVRDVEKVREWGL